MVRVPVEGVFDPAVANPTELAVRDLLVFGLFYHLARIHIFNPLDSRVLQTLLHVAHLQEPQCVHLPEMTCKMEPYQTRIRLQAATYYFTLTLVKIIVTQVYMHHTLILFQKITNTPSTFHTSYFVPAQI